MSGNTTNKTFSVKNGLDVANTIVLDSSRNLRNVASINANSFIAGNGTASFTGNLVPSQNTTFSLGSEQSIWQ
jgi:hypothetical protein